LIGINLATTKEMLIGAILESILFRVYDNLSLKEYESVKSIFVDGGMTKNMKFMQFQADMISKTINVRERDTCWGVAKGVLTNLGLLFGGFANENTTNYSPNKESHEKFVGKYQRWCRERRKQYGWNEE
jgi:glycerol kinase